MAFLPGFEENVSYLDWSRSEIVIFITTSYIVIATYVFLIMLALRNIFVILIKQKEYKNLPILAFYCYTILAVTLRPIYLFWCWTTSPVFSNLDLIQQGSKLSVGIVQDWITVDLAIRIRNAKFYTEISESGKRKLRFASGVLFAITTLIFAAFSTAVIVSAHKSDDGYAFADNYCFVYNFIGTSFLIQVIIMILLVAWLFVETQKAVNRERRARSDGRVTQNLRRERCTYAIISTIFALSYLGRYFLNEYGSGCDDEVWSLYTIEMSWFIVLFFEGASMGVLMLFHCMNFKLFSSQDKED